MKIILAKSELTQAANVGSKILRNIVEKFEIELPLTADNLDTAMVYLSKMENIVSKFGSVTFTETEIIIESDPEFTQDVLKFIDDLASESITFISKHKLLMVAAMKPLKLLFKKTVESVKDKFIKIVEPLKEPFKEFMEMLEKKGEEMFKKYDQ